MGTSSTRIPKPKDWQEFERQIELLAQCWLNDPNAKGNGRQGQPQHGVDVYGRRDGKILVGIQCKEKFESAVTEDELRNEVTKAVKFKPKLKEFILATTAGRDAKIQEVARLITAERNGFSVEVWGWEDIEQIVAIYPKAAKAFDPTYTPLISDEIRQASATSTDQAAIILSAVRSLEALVAGRTPEIVSEDNNRGPIYLFDPTRESGNIGPWWRAIRTYLKFSRKPSSSARWTWRSLPPSATRSHFPRRLSTNGRRVFMRPA